MKHSEREGSAALRRELIYRLPQQGTLFLGEYPALHGFTTCYDV